MGDKQREKKEILLNKTEFIIEIKIENIISWSSGLKSSER